ncbi:hypothetical protein Q3G72_026616 [Acer saccharum]|nr:hypothetical protein Q3G72_026616 [Acer saccharum]
MFDRCLAVSVLSLDYPSHILGFVSRQRTFYKTRLQPVLATRPSSILLHTDDSGKFLESKNKSGVDTASLGSDTFLKQANTIGIIGGLSVDSTLNFSRKLVQQSDGENCPPFVLCSDPVLSKELLLHERNSFPSISGAQCIVMPCHISHTWHDEVSKGCSVPFLHVGECVAKELKEAKLKPLEAGSPLRIGVLATNATLTAGFYQEKLQREGFEVVLPDKATMEHTVIPAIDALNRKDMEGAQNLLRIALQVLLVRVVSTVVLASDDMRDLFTRDDPLLRKCIDPMDLLARSTIKWALSADKGT